MTAQRWWVKLGARWYARFQTTEGLLRSLSLGVTAFSTFSLVLQNAGYGHLVPYFGVCAFVGWTAFTFYFSEGGVYNQAKRDLADLATNWAGPSMRMRAELSAVGIVAGLKESGLDTMTEQKIQTAIKERWSELREGVDINDN